MMKWFTKGTSTEVHTIGHQEVVSVQGRRRNDKYTRLHTIIKFLHYVVSSSPLQIKSFCWTWAPSLCGNLNMTHALRATRAREQRGRRQTSELFLFVEIQKWSCYPGGSSCFPYSSATWQASVGAVSHWAPSRPTLPQPPSILPILLPSSLYPSTILPPQQESARGPQWRQPDCAGGPADSLEISLCV